MTRRGAVACVAAFAAAVSVGALGYVVVWAFDLSELLQPAAPELPSRQVAPTEEKLAPAPRRKPVVVIAPHVPGDDARAVMSLGAHAATAGDAVTVARTALGDESSWLLAVAPLPVPPTPGMDGPRMPTSARASAPASAGGRPMPDNSDAVSPLIPQNEAAAPPPPPIQVPVHAETPAPTEPETTGTVRPPVLILRRPAPAQPARARDDVMAGPPGVSIIRGAPPVPATSPGIVRPGPLIIHVPTPPRR